MRCCVCWHHAVEWLGSPFKDRLVVGNISSKLGNITDDEVVRIVTDALDAAPADSIGECQPQPRTPHAVPQLYRVRQLPRAGLGLMRTAAAAQPPRCARRCVPTVHPLSLPTHP